jgi:hypothetical protein
VNAGLYVRNGPSRRYDPKRVGPEKPRRSVLDEITDGFLSVSDHPGLPTAIVVIGFMTAFLLAMVLH